MPSEKERAGPAPESGFYRWSKVVLERMALLPPWTITAIVLVLLAIGLIAILPIAIPALILLLAIVVWLAILSWPVIDTNQRVVRVVMVALVAATLVGRITGYL